MTARRSAKAPAAKPSEAEYEGLRALIAQKFGIDYPPRRREVLAERVGGRLVAHELSSLSEYSALLRGLPAGSSEWDALAEVITNSETYFFREPAHFEQVVALLPELTGGRADRPVRVLSAGCSSGEEAYSLAMVLASRALLSKRFEVHGVDVTPTRLAKARAGAYTSRALTRGGPPPAGVRVEHFGALQGGAWQIHDWLRARVSFHHKNLVDPGGLGLGLFDLVFCRNVLIYAHPDRAPAVLGVLCAALRPGGYLFLGSSESITGGDAPLRAVRLGDHTAYVKSDGDSGSHRR